MLDVRRREFITLLGGAAAWPLAARAQGKHPVVGFLASGEPRSIAASSAAFLADLKEAGFVDGQNLTIEYRWAEGRFERLPALAAELVQRPVDVIMAAQGTVSALAAKRATSTVPIVFVTADDPVAAGLVASLNRPGGNLTGVSRMGTILGAKNLELIHEVVPAVSRVGLLINPKRPTADAQRKNATEAAAVLGKAIRVLDGSGEAEIDAAFQTIVSEQIGALLVPFDPVLNAHRRQIIALAARHRLPAAYALREFVADGGLMSYGDSATESYGLAGGYVGRILKGAKPADLPVQQATRLELALNLKTAKTLGLTISIPLLGRADEVIE
jgi:putative ABC transport system substrate-binding protein